LLKVLVCEGEHNAETASLGQHVAEIARQAGVILEFVDEDRDRITPLGRDCAAAQRQL
jgi:hypothetical protein